MASKEDVTGRKQGNKKCLHLLAYPFPCTQKGFEFCLELLSELLCEDKYGQRVKFPLSVWFLQLSVLPTAI